MLKDWQTSRFDWAQCSDYHHVAFMSISTQKWPQSFPWGNKALFVFVFCLNALDELDENIQEVW